jgi:hypothetical protein
VTRLSASWRISYSGIFISAKKIRPHNIPTASIINGFKGLEKMTSKNSGNSTTFTPKLSNMLGAQQKRLSGYFTQPFSNTNEL